MSKKNVYHLPDYVDIRLRQIQEAAGFPTPDLALVYLINGRYHSLVSCGKIIELDPDGGDAA